ncbi:polysaccharide export protein [Epilithonimonas sp. JDS]|uniref:polysaccharide biosynthesis/export family protein n=1 Tax=Epilithonimonas sp. JDS TaxID=2902797 RepID=UPI001E40D431|nr:polysaccharide biosynthesis/export family protein [Epilithonimonas sp. JDS]MCD9853441.1 polysaccharide export protein [Epilithonimonas sp. JDS]
MKNYLLSVCLPILLVVSSCKTNQEIDYLKNIENVAIEASQRQYSSTIQPADQLSITVLAKDNEVAKPFNQNYYSTDMSQFSTMPTRNASVEPTYLVDSNGNIDFPILGTLSTKDKTLENFKAELKDKLAKYIKNPGVNIRTLNYKVTVLGEINRPGTIPIPEGQPTTILNVIGMAGDLTIYGQRKNILLVRNVDGVTTKHYVDLTNAELFNSPEYYVRQNDVIYVSPNKARKSAASYGPQTGIWISVASVLIGVLALIFRN